MSEPAIDNDGFYPFLLDLAPEARRVNLERLPSTGRGSGSRCKSVLPKKLVWRDLRVAVQQQRRELSQCVADPSDVAAVFNLASDGTVTDVTVEGNLDSEQSACLTQALRKVHVRPFKGGPYKRRLSQLR